MLSAQSVVPSSAAGDDSTATAAMVAAAPSRAKAKNFVSLEKQGFPIT